MLEVSKMNWLLQVVSFTGISNMPTTDQITRNFKFKVWFKMFLYDFDGNTMYQIRHGPNAIHALLMYMKTILIVNNLSECYSYFVCRFQVFLMLSWGTVVYYDGQKGHIVNRGFLLNGIAISPNKQ